MSQLGNMKRQAREKRTTGSAHHKDTDYSNPVDMKGFSRIHFMLAGCLAIGLILIALFVK